MQNQKSLEHFKRQYACAVFPPPREIKYAIYSKKIWKKFLGLLPGKNSSLLDLGCGGGTVLYCLEKLGYKYLRGLDFVKAIPSGFLRMAQFSCGEVTATGLESDSFDGLVAAMVIEHVDEKKFVGEISRILKKGGAALVTSIMKSSWAWYFYKNQFGERVVEPTHLKEYKSRGEFERLFFRDFEIVETDIIRLKYPLIDPIFRLLYRLTGSEKLRKMPTRNFWLEKLRSVRVPIPGYYVVETVIRKK